MDRDSKDFRKSKMPSAANRKTEDRQTYRKYQEAMGRHAEDVRSTVKSEYDQGGHCGYRSGYSQGASGSGYGRDSYNQRPVKQEGGGTYGDYRRQQGGRGGGGGGGWRGRGGDGGGLAAQMRQEQEQKHAATIADGNPYPLALKTNMFKLETSTKWTIYQYYVTFEPAIDNKDLRKRLLYSKRDTLGSYRVFDGRMLYLNFKLAEKTTELDYTHHNITDGKIVIKLSTELNPWSAQCLQIYNIVIRSLMYTIEMKAIGRNFYLPSTIKNIPKHNIEVMTGYRTAVKQCEGGYKLCVDATHKIIRNRSALEELLEVYSLAENEHGDFTSMCKRRLVGQVVMTMYNYCTYTITELDMDSNPLSTFSGKNGDEIRYCDYMLQQYNMTATDKRQPLLIAKARHNSDPIKLIPEFCNLTDLSDDMRKDGMVMRDISQHTRMTPETRSRALSEFVRKINGDQKCSNSLKNWQISIPFETETIQAEVLPPETLYFGDGKKISYRDFKADWTLDTRGVRYLNPRPLDNWILLTDNSCNRHVRDFMNMLNRVTPPMGINVSSPEVFNIGHGNVANYVACLREQLSAMQVKLVVCFFPRNMSDLYCAVKKICYVEYGVSCQCVTQRAISNQRSLMTIVSKIAYLCSVKLGAEPWGIKIPIRQMMVIGIDTYNDKYENCSINAVVCSYNDNLSRYVSKVAYNRKGEGQNNNDGISKCISDALRCYKDMNKALPLYVVVYRDGVSDGQLEKLKTVEMEQVKDAFKNVGEENYEPNLAFIVCQKRGNERFYTDSMRKFSNPPAGTLVAKHVTKDMNDFFLVSQTVTQGTAGATHYIVLHNDLIMMDTAKLAKLTYKLTHLYYNTLATIQVPAPVHYAHKMAYMVGQVLHKEPHQRLYSKPFYL